MELEFCNEAKSEVSSSYIQRHFEINHDFHESFEHIFYDSFIQSMSGIVTFLTWSLPKIDSFFSLRNRLSNLTQFIMIWYILSHAKWKYNRRKEVCVFVETYSHNHIGIRLQFPVTIKY